MADVSRRSLLVGGAAVAGLAAAGIIAGNVITRQAGADERGGNWDVIVVGAGSAGIGAARRLVDQNPSLRVAIVEARDRIGGRMFTDRTSMGIPVERGCELVHGGPYADTYPWIKEAGFDMRMFTKNYIRLNNADDSSPSHAWHAPDAPASWEFPAGIPDGLVRFDPAGEAQPLPEALPREKADAYLARLGIAPDNIPSGLRYLLTDDAEPLYATDAAAVGEVLTACIRYSLHPEEAPEPEELDADDPKHNDGDYKIIGGYDQLLTFIADDIPVFLDTVVEEVQHSKSGVELFTSQGTMSARRVIMAVPAGVMQRRDIDFSAGLPDRKWVAFDEFQYSHIFKCLLEFEGQVFTPDGSATWGYAESMDLTPTTLWNASIAQPEYGGQVIVGWETGEAARELHALPLEQKYEAVLDVVRKSAGDPGLQYKKALMTDWANEPFSWGAYGHGGNEKDMSAPTDDVLFWAGMRTSTVTASYVSGVDEADELLKHL